MSLEVAQSYVTRIDHVGIAVRDLDQAKEFYAKSLGLKSIHEETNEEQGVREAMLAVGDSGSCIQLLAPLTDDSPSENSLPAAAKESSKWPTPCRIWMRCAITCAALACECCTTPQARNGKQPRELRSPKGRRRRINRTRGTGN